VLNMNGIPRGEALGTSQEGRCHCHPRCTQSLPGGFALRRRGDSGQRIRLGSVLQGLPKTREPLRQHARGGPVACRPVPRRSSQAHRHRDRCPRR
jgi:hypothetical protein